MRRLLAALLSLLLVLAPVPAYADSLSITAWQTGDALNSTNLNARMNSISTWANGLVANDNIKSSAAIAASRALMVSNSSMCLRSAGTASRAAAMKAASLCISARWLLLP